MGPRLEKFPRQPRQDTWMVSNKGFLYEVILIGAIPARVTKTAKSINIHVMSAR